MARKINWKDYPGLTPVKNGVLCRIQVKGKEVYKKVLYFDPNTNDGRRQLVEHRAEILALARVAKRGKELVTQAEVELARELAGMDPNKPSSMTVKEAIEKYTPSWEYKNGKGFKDHVAMVRRLNNQWGKFHNRPIGSITRAEIKTHLLSMGVTTKTMNNYKGSLATLMDEVGLDPNPCVFETYVEAATPRLAKRKQKEIRQAEELARRRKRYIYRPWELPELIHALGALPLPENGFIDFSPLEGQAQAYFAIQLGGGLRPAGEVLGLQWADFSHKSKQIRVTRQYGAGDKQLDETKTKADRSVTIMAWAADILEDLAIKKFGNDMNRRFRNGYIFLNYQRRPYKDAVWLNEQFRLAHKALEWTHISDEQIDPYNCRRTNATARVMGKRVNHKWEAAEMGHSIQMLLDRYCEVADKDWMEADIEKLFESHALKRSKK